MAGSGGLRRCVALRVLDAGGRGSHVGLRLCKRAELGEAHVGVEVKGVGVEGSRFRAVVSKKVTRSGVREGSSQRSGGHARSVVSSSMI